jgi:uncharacterized protein YbjT (DUF2867 family)
MGDGVRSKEIPMILVTGATGENGSAAIREFARRGEPVRALVRSAARAASMGAPASVEVVEGICAVRRRSALR